VQYVLKDTDASFHLDFLLDGNLVVPDTSSVRLTLTEPDGTVLTGYNDISLSPTVGESFVVFETTALANSKSNDYELRQARVDYTVDTRPFTQFLNYRIVDRINLPVNPTDVRKVLGISDDEWPDSNVDIVDAYSKVQLEETLDGVDTEAILNGGTALVSYLIEAIKLKAAIDILPVLELVATQSQQADNVSFRRFEKVDFPYIRKNLMDRYSIAISQTVGQADITLTLATTGVGTDAVTGDG